MSAEPASKRAKIEISEDPSRSIFVVHISDTHRVNLNEVKIPAIPDGWTGVLIHSGDFESANKMNEWHEGDGQTVEDKAVMERYIKLVVCGNHETTQGNKLGHLRECQGVFETYEDALRASKVLQRGCNLKNLSLLKHAVLLHNSGVKINGVLFYGTPFGLKSAETSNNSFELDSEEDLKKIYGFIPDAVHARRLTNCRTCDN